MIATAVPAAPDRIVIASRGSRLARRQAAIVVDLVTAARPGINVDVVTVTTAGDLDKSRPFAAIGGKGLFTTEVERAVVEERADIAVHSAKDLTAELAEGCAIVGVPARAPVHDVVVGGSGATGAERLESLDRGARLGTSSMRRRALLAVARPDISPVELRGNIDTRLRKVADGEVDAAVLAAAGIGRLRGKGDAAERDTGAPLDPRWWVPPPGQGALAIEALSGRADLAALFGPLSDHGAWAELMAERAFAAELEGGCSVPLGCLARAAGADVVVSGWLGFPDGSSEVRDRISGPVNDAAALGRELGVAVYDAGGRDILEELKTLTESEVPVITAP